jgi:hypothetical protein
MQSYILHIHNQFNCMRLLTGTKWGANSYTLRTIYFALIRSKIDYGCEVYNSASHAVKKLLDNIVYDLTMSIYNQILCQGI